MTLDDGLLVHDFTNTGARWQKPEHQLISEALRLASSATACSEWQGPKFESTNFKEVQPHGECHLEDRFDRWLNHPRDYFRLQQSASCDISGQNNPDVQRMGLADL